VKYGAFLRGINLGSQRRVSSAELRPCFEALGFDDVSTFRTSGNVAFRTGRRSSSGLKRAIEEALVKKVGFEVLVFLRTEAELRAMSGNEPFPNELISASKGKLQVVLVSAKPPEQLRRKVLALGSDDDRLTFGARELYWLPSGGTREAALDYAQIENLLGPTTRRTKGTLDQMVEKYFSNR
jgi:uncharacterized protein (DUF1697 family)